MDTTSSRRQRLPALIAILLIASAALFGAGVATERATGTDNHASSEAGKESGTHSDERESREAGGTGEERVLGIRVESPATVASAIAVSALLAALLWWRPRRWVFGVAAAFALGATLFDVLEAGRQIEARRGGIALIAALVAVLHLVVVAAAAATMLRRPSPRLAPTQS